MTLPCIMCGTEPCSACLWDEAEQAEADRVARLERDLAEAHAVLRSVEHVRLPGMAFARCPACLSPLDLSQPHEDGCRLAEVLR